MIFLKRDPPIIMEYNVFLLYEVLSSCFALACRVLRITDDILSRYDCMICLSSSERMKYERKSRQHFNASFALTGA